MKEKTEKDVARGLPHIAVRGATGKAAIKILIETKSVHQIVIKEMADITHLSLTLRVRLIPLSNCGPDFIHCSPQTNVWVEQWMTFLPNPYINTRRGP